MKPRRAKDTGFSLLELVVVVAIFALVAVLSVQALQGTLRAQKTLSIKSDQNAELGLALARLRLDLESAVPLVFVDVDGVVQQSLVVANDSDSIGLSVGGGARFGDEPSAGLGRIDWRFDADNGQILRRYVPTLIPARTQNDPIELPVMGDVLSLEIQTYSIASGWITGWPAPEDPATLPLAIRVVIQTGTLGRLDLVEHL